MFLEGDSEELIGVFLTDWKDEPHFTWLLISAQCHLPPTSLGISRVGGTELRVPVAKVAIAFPLAGQGSMGPCPYWNHRTAQVLRDFENHLVQTFVGKGA